MASIFVLTETERAYIAGLLDGEGYLFISHIVSSNSFQVGVRTQMSSKETIEWLSEKIGHSFFERDSNKYLGNREQKCKWKMTYITGLQGIAAQELLKLIRPYMITKAEQADVILSFPVFQRKEGQSKQMSEELKLQQALCYIRMRDLNKKGEKEDGIDLDS